MLPNIQDVLDSMRSLLISALLKDSLVVKDAVTGYITDAETRLGNLAQGALNGELSYSFVVARLKEETVNIKDQFLSITEIALADLQEIANQVVGIFESALKNAISVVKSDG